MSPTKRQLDALRFVRGYQLAKGYSPTLREIASGLGIKSHSVVYYQLERMEERRLVARPADHPFWRDRAIDVLIDIPIPRAPDGAPLYFVEIAG